MLQMCVMHELPLQLRSLIGQFCGLVYNHELLGQFQLSYLRYILLRDDVQSLKSSISLFSETTHDIMSEIVKYGSIKCLVWITGAGYPYIPTYLIAIATKYNQTECLKYLRCDDITPASINDGMFYQPIDDDDFYPYRM